MSTSGWVNCEDRALAVPQAEHFADIFTKVTPIDIMQHKVWKTPVLRTVEGWEAGSWSDPDRKSRGEVRGFLTVKTRAGGERSDGFPNYKRSHYLIEEMPEPVIDAILGQSILGDCDSLSFEAIEWDGGRALIVAHNSLIIGGPWVAIVSAASLPR